MILVNSKYVKIQLLKSGEVVSKITVVAILDSFSRLDLRIPPNQPEYYEATVYYIPIEFDIFLLNKIIRVTLKPEKISKSPAYRFQFAPPQKDSSGK